MTPEPTVDSLPCDVSYEPSSIRILCYIVMMSLAAGSPSDRRGVTYAKTGGGDWTCRKLPVGGPGLSKKKKRKKKREIFSTVARRARPGLVSATADEFFAAGTVITSVFGVDGVSVARRLSRRRRSPHISSIFTQVKFVYFRRPVRNSRPATCIGHASQISDLHGRPNDS